MLFASVTYDLHGQTALLSDHSTTVSKLDYDRLYIDPLLKPLFTVSRLLDASFDALVESRSTDSDQNLFTQRAIHLGSVILEAGKRSASKRSTVHNTSVWPLPTDLTIKVFSMLDTRSTCIAAATTQVKIILSQFNNHVASKLIERAGNALQWGRFGSDLKLLDSAGIIPMRMSDQAAAIKLAICDDIGEKSYDFTDVAGVLVQMLSKLPEARHDMTK
ncbi:hypothetical protein LXL04_018817 [Taraxacum kok-saghyz]